jgi:hypothetical protein
MRELLRPLVLAPQEPFKPNDAADLIHAVIPAGYCDFVLLDGKWADRVERVRKRVADQGLRLKLARVFSQRNDGIERFLDELGSFPREPSDPGQPPSTP